MIHFIEKTWFLWWMLAIVVAVRWFHALSMLGTMQDPDSLALATEEAEEAYVSTLFLQKAHFVSLTETQRAF